MKQKSSKKRKCLFTCFVLLLTLTLSIICKVDNVNVSADSPINQLDLLNAQKESSEQNDKILKFFKDQNKFSYPNYYAGSYLDINGELVVMTSDDSQDTKDKLKNISGNNKLKFKSVKHSYNELTDIIDTIANGKNQNLKNKSLGMSVDSDIFSDINGTVLLDNENKIEVYIKNLNSSKIEKFKNKFKDKDIDIFIFKEAVDAKEEAGTVAPGKYIVDWASGSALSTAFRVRQNSYYGTTTDGFLTCGHGNSIGDSIYDYNGNLLGTVTSRSCSGGLDVSFVTLSSGTSSTNSISYSNYTLSTTASDPIVGKIIYLSGATSAKVTSGTIQSTNVSFEYDGVYFNGIIGGNYPSASGDSGGVIFSDLTSGSGKTMGIHRGTANGYKVFTSYQKVTGAFSVFRY